jgi:hypothetical protein
VGVVGSENVVSAKIPKINLPCMALVVKKPQEVFGLALSQVESVTARR